jgi:hypothetical protein
MAPYSHLAIEGEGGTRISISDCKLQPLNLLIPGSAPIMVPRNKAWPGAKTKEAINLKAPTSAANSHDAGEGDSPDEEPPCIKTRSRRASKVKAPSMADMRVKLEKKLEGPCKKSTNLGKLATEAKQRRKLERQVKEQERYIAKLKAKYAAKAKKKKKKKKQRGESQNDTSDSDSDLNGGSSSDATAGNVSQASDASTGGEQSDASEQVRQLIKSLKIKAAGTEGAEFTPSEDSQLLARKENNETWAVIAKFMNRPKKQLQKRHKELLALGKTAETAGTSGPEGNTEAAAATTDTDKGVPAGDVVGGLLDLGGLQARLEATAAEQAQAEKKAADSSDEEDAVKAPKGSPVGSLKKGGGEKKKDKKRPKQTPSPAAVGGESGYESGSEDVPLKVFIGTYGKQLLTDKSTIPEADDKFDENDCILMALADARRKGDRWKQMQADFANLTGRMVPVEVLKYKFGEGERPEGY